MIRVSPLRLVMLVSAGLFIAATAPAKADECTLLLSHGLYDYHRQTYSNFDSRSFHENFCAAYSRQSSSGASVGVTVPVDGVPVPLSFSQQQANAIGSWECDQTANSSQVITKISDFSQYLDTGIGAEFVQCEQIVSGGKSGLAVKMLFDENQQRDLTISVRYVAPPAQSDKGTLSRLDYDHHQWTCERFPGDLLSQQGKPNGIGSGYLNQHCVRTIADPHLDQFKKTWVYANATEFRFYSPNLDPVIRRFTPIVADAPANPEYVPLGGIIYLFSKDGSFTPPRGYEICDGTNFANQVKWPGKKPNLIHRFVMGMSPTNDAGKIGQDVIPDGTTSESVTAQIPALQTGETPGGGNGSGQAQSGNNGPFAIDIHHKHPQVYPPYTGLIPLIRTS